MPLYETIGSIINDAAVELGLEPLANDGAGAHSATDANFVLLWRLAKRTGRMLMLEREWRQLRKEHSFTTDGIASSFDLPTDFGRMIDQTGWNRTEDRPLHPSGEQFWSYLKASDSGMSFTAVFLPLSATIELWPQPPAAGDTIAFAYVSRYWGFNGIGSVYTPNLSDPVAGSQFALFDPALFVPALKLAYCRARGFDTSAVLEEYRDALARVASANVVAAPVLNVTPCWGAGVRLLDERNLPDSGYGS